MNAIEEAVKTTSAVRSHVRAAALRIDQDSQANAYGILMHPDQYKWNLLAAIDELKKAVAAIEGGHWPSDSDYDRL
jgi:hypothetical protein